MDDEQDRCTQCGFSNPGSLIPHTPAHCTAWKAFHDDPETVSAQNWYTGRQNELQALRDFYNGEMTRARLEFQQRTHIAMLALTNTLRALDEAELAAQPTPNAPE